MGHYGTTIAVANRTAHKITLDPATKAPSHGTWIQQPKDIPAGGAVVFSIHPSSEDIDGSKGEVRYTIEAHPQSKFKINYDSNSSNNECRAGVSGLSDSFKCSYALTETERNEAHPLVNVVYIDTA